LTEQKDKSRQTPFIFVFVFKKNLIFVFVFKKNLICLRVQEELDLCLKDFFKNSTPTRATPLPRNAYRRLSQLLLPNNAKEGSQPRVAFQH
jgi:hypothetical protein